MNTSKKPSLDYLLADTSIGLEARVTKDDHQSLRVWLRLLSSSNEIEAEIRRRLRRQFGMSLARFDYLAQLQRHPDGLTMSMLSNYLMVTGGNVTGLTNDAVRDGLVRREVSAEDRRSFRVSLTDEGRAVFEAAASAHEGWVIELFAGLNVAERTQLNDLLGRLRQHLSAAAPRGTARQAAG